MTVVLVRRNDSGITKGHLLEHTTEGKSYEVVEEYRGHYRIMVDNKSLIWVSKNCRKSYFFETHRE